MADSDAPTKPPVLQDSTFVIQESVAYKAARTGAIWMNKLFFSSLALLAVWVLLGLLGAVDMGCTDGYEVVEGTNGTTDQEAETCSVFLNTTALYLGSMSLVSFTLSIGFGVLGLIVGKNIVAMTPTADEVGAGAGEGAGAAQDPEHDDEQA